MTHADEKNLISLKDAAQITGYSADYIGQLIRSGKLPGKQVFTGLQWMTSAKAIKDYRKISKTKKPETLGDKFKLKRRKLFMELDILRLFFATFKSAIPLLIIVIISFVALFTFIVFSIFNPQTEIKNAPSLPQKVESLTF